jgi:hypothetical protein
MESASQLLAFSYPFKSWFGLFNIFFEAYQIIAAENLYALTFSDIATSR